MSTSKYSIVCRSNGVRDPIPAAIPAPKPDGEALWKQSRWTVWRVNGVPTLYETRPFKVRETEKDRPSIHHRDVVAIGPVSDVTAACGIDPMDLAEARAAVDFHLHGLTA